jgi:nicotinamide mononucleotide transporter
MSMAPLEMLGLVTGLLAVLLLIRQNIWTWPIGMIYAVVSVWVFAQARLYADLGLHLFYVGMNAYGWWFWLRGGAVERSGDAELPVALTPARWHGLLLGLGLVGAITLGTLLARFTNADYAYADSLTTSFSFVAMWMQARKYLECWWVWFGVDVVAAGLYLLKAQAGETGLYFYAVLYLVYLGLAVLGWRAWRQSWQCSIAAAKANND